MQHLRFWQSFAVKLQPQSLDGSQMKINILLKRLPKLKSGIDPRLAFAGTFHANESFSQFEQTFKACPIRCDASQNAY